MANGAQNFSRALEAADLGLKGAVQELRGTLSLQEGLATVHVDMISGEIKNPFQVVNNILETAKKAGATTIRIEGTIANERLYESLRKRYKLISEGATDYLEFNIPN